MLASNEMRQARELLSPLTLVLLLVGAALFFAHDPGDSSVPWLGIAAIALVCTLYATRAPPGGLAALLPLAALVVWCAVSISWSVEPDRSWSYANRTLVYLAFALVGALLGAEPRRLLYGFGVLLGAVCVWALAGKVFPWLYEDYGRLARLRAPVGYWNALALLADIALPIGLCLATRLRVPGTLLVFGWLVVLGLTYSRGGVLVAVVVVALWMWLSNAWLESLSTLVAAGLPAAAALAVAYSLPGLTSDGQSHTARVHAGLVFGVVLAADALIAAALSRFPLPEVTLVRRIALAVLAVAVAGAVAVGAAHAQRWWHSISSPSEVTNSPGHLVSTGGNFRTAWWTQAWRGWKAHPVLGTGAGTFTVTNLRYRTTSLDQTLEPHDLPLQFLTETGVVGAILFAASIVWLVVRGRRRPGPQLALALALPAYFLHGLLDVDWDFLSVSAPVFLIAGALVARPSAAKRPSGFAIALATALGLVASASLVVVWLADRWDSQAAAAVSVNDSRAITLANRSRKLNPFALDPLFQAAFAETDIAGRLIRTKPVGWRPASAAALDQARSDYEKATRVQPDSALAWDQLGYFQLITRGCPRAALPDFSKATVLDGRNPGYNLHYSEALALVNSGKPRC
jgi:hypothetical protein